MSRQREGRETEFFKGIIRSQKAEIKRLKRQLRDLQKNSLLVEPEEVEEFEDVPNKIICPKCREGEFRLFEFNGRSFLICNDCAHRVKA
jgi:hypothetical protein